MFDYRLEKRLKEATKKVAPTMATFLDEIWKEQTGFTMKEVMPTIQNMLAKMYQIPYQIQCRYVLKTNSLKSILQFGKLYHMSIEYYGIPIDETIKIPHSIERSGKKYKTEMDSSGNITLKKMSYNEIWENQVMEMKFMDKKERNRIIWIGTEESDIEIDELESMQELCVPLEHRNLNLNLPLESSIIAYIEARENHELVDEKVAVKK